MINNLTENDPLNRATTRVSCVTNASSGWELGLKLLTTTATLKQVWQTIPANLVTKLIVILIQYSVVEN